MLLAASTSVSNTLVVFTLVLSTRVLSLVTRHMVGQRQSHPLGDRPCLLGDSLYELVPTVSIGSWNHQL